MMAGIAATASVPAVAVGSATALTATSVGVGNRWMMVPTSRIGLVVVVVVGQVTILGSS